jgi:hypothetical protein
MIKKMFFLTPLLVPGLAYGDNSSANLSVQVVPAGTNTSIQCPSTAPAEASAAGYTTMAFCNDFTVPIATSAAGVQNIAGTGLPYNWFNCTYDNTPAVWYDALYDSGPPPPCSDANGSRVSQVTDTGVTPNTLALQLVYLITDQAATPGGKSSLTMSTASVLDGGPASTWPQNSYYEVTYRDNLSTQPNACGPTCQTLKGNTDFFGIDIKQRHSNTTPYTEYDFVENFSINCCLNDNNALHSWGGNTADGNHPFAPTGANQHFFDTYHTYGMLITGNGTTSQACGYIDHVATGNCLAIPDQIKYDPTQRNFWIIFVGNEGDPSLTLDVNIYAWIKSFAVWSCPNWNSTSSPANQCNLGLHS